MTENYSGSYFDGQSASPQQVSANIKNRQLHLSSENGFRREVRENEFFNLEEVGNDRLLVRFGKDGIELLDIRSGEFKDLFRTEFPKVPGRRNLLERLATSKWQGISILLGLLVGIVFLVYFVIIPWTGDLAARHFPQEYEEELGESLFRSSISMYSVDSAKTDLLHELIKPIDFKTTYDLEIVVVDYDQKNAFAVPGGHIVVFSGILKDMKHYSELIGLLAHEVSHVNKRHSLRLLFRNLSTYIFISAVLNDVSGLSTIVLQNADKIKTLSYSRRLEQEADMEGLQIMFENKVDPNGMIGLFETLMKDNAPPEELEFLSSHPVTEKRIDYIREKISETPHTVEQNDSMQAVWEKLIRSE